ncbi:MAG: ATP-binding cassette domain-containing protein [Pseudomonadota bacterium]
MLSANGLSVVLGGRAVLQGANVAIREGEVVAVLGPNGAGKSTLLAALTGALVPSEGNVFYGDRELPKIGVSELALLRAVLEQTPARDLDFTVQELLELALDRAIPPEDASVIVARALNTMDIERYTTTRIRALSGGEAHRAHMARVLAQLWAGRHLGRGRYLLVDEPTASLDLRHQSSVLRAVREAADDGAGVLIILHELNQAMAIADRVVLLADGRIAMEGTPAEVLVPEVLEPVYGVPIDLIEHRQGHMLSPRYAVPSKQNSTSQLREETTDVRCDEPV